MNNAAFERIPQRLDFVEIRRVRPHQHGATDWRHDLAQARLAMKPAANVLYADGHTKRLTLSQAAIELSCGLLQKSKENRRSTGLSGGFLRLQVLAAVRNPVGA